MAAAMHTPISRGTKKRHARSRGASVRMEKTPPKMPWRGLIRMVVLGGLALGLYFSAGNAGDVVDDISRQKVEQIIVEGKISFVSEADVVAIVNTFIRESLLTVNMDRIKRELVANPWIRTVEIRRQWPDTLILDLTEERAIARWGEAGLLNQDGEIFRPSDISAQTTLPHLYGPDSDARAVMEQYQLFNQLLYPRGLRIMELGVSSRGAWSLELDNGVSILVGKDKVVEKVRRLVEFAGPDFIEQMVDIEAIDLRYSNGIAVRTRQHSGEEVVSL